MGMGAPKQGSTLPPQGGKGGGRQPTVPAQGGKGGVQQPVRPQVPAPGGKTAAPGTVFNPNNPNNVPMPGGKAPGAVQPTQPQVQQPYRPIGLPPGQVPAQGGKGGTSNVPGYAQPYVNALNPQQPQVPAQGGKAPLTPEQQAALGPYINPVRPMPQVQPPYTPFGPGSAGPGVLMQPQVLPQQPGQVPAQGGKGTSRQDYDRMMAQVSFAPGTTPPTYEEFVQNRLNPKPMPQVMPQKPGTPAPGLNGVPGNQNPLYFGPGKPAPAPAQPQVMPRPVPQVMPRQPTPKPAPQVMPIGLAGLLRGRR